MGCLAIFFLVVGLEIKREFTVGRLATLRSGALPVIAAFGGIILPIVIYLSIAPCRSVGGGLGSSDRDRYGVCGRDHRVARDTRVRRAARLSDCRRHHR